jgi:hypothetical protein
MRSSFQWIGLVGNILTGNHGFYYIKYDGVSGEIFLSTNPMIIVQKGSSLATQ